MFGLSHFSQKNFNVQRWITLLKYGYIEIIDALRITDSFLKE